MLSGGTIRRMNLAMAFAGTTGSSKAVLLDEPTSGYRGCIIIHRVLVDFHGVVFVFLGISIIY